MAVDEDKMRAIARQEFNRMFEDNAAQRHAQIEEIVEITVKKTLQGFGVDTDNPTQVQENFINLRSWSDLKKAISQSIVTTLMRSVTLGIIALILLGGYVWLTGHKPPP
jgi:hypothetical protein